MGSRNILLKIKNEFQKLYMEAIHRFAHLIKTENVVGDNVENSQNCYWCFDMAGDSQNVKYSNWSTYGLRDSYDTGPGTGGKSELTYEGVSIGVNNNRCTFGCIIWYCHDVFYSFWLQNCSNCFGCVSLKNKQYCIFNKQYSKEEYFSQLEKIIKQMKNLPYIDKQGIKYQYGEFFPIEFSPYPYNATVGQDYTPITKEYALENNYFWRDETEKNYKPTLIFNKLPDTINNIDESILDQIISCANTDFSKNGCTKAFRIIRQEFDFYKRFNIPIPQYCPNCRHDNRLKQRNPMKLWHRQCMCEKENHNHSGKCQVEFETSYSTDRPEIVYCEKCYQQEIY
jgi:hypothetical protein